MKLKLDAAGNAVLQEGKPVYVKDDGAEIAFDAARTVVTIANLNAEAKSHRERAESAEAKLKSFEGITDPALAIKAINTVKNLDDKKLVDAGEVEKVRTEAVRAVEEKYAPTLQKLTALETELYNERIGGSFSRSKFIAEKFAIPADLVQARFGNHFTVKDGKIIAKDKAGNEIYSPTRPGEIADFDEALSVIVDQYPYKDQILKGSGASGTGASGNNQGAGGKRTVTRAQFDKLSPAEQHKIATDKSVALVD